MFLQSTSTARYSTYRQRTVICLSRVNRVLSPTPGRVSLEVDRHLYVCPYNIGSQPPEVSETTRSAETTE